MKKDLVIISILSIICLAIFVLLGLNGIFYRIYFGSAIYFASFLVAKKYTKQSTKMILSLLGLPIVLLFGTIHILNFEETLISLPSTFTPIIGILFGALWVRSGYRWVAAVSILAFAGLCTWYVKSGHEHWGHYRLYGKYDYNVLEPCPPLNFYSLDEQQLVNNKTMEGKTFVLDLWMSYCGPCFKAFPTLEKKAKLYSKDTTIKFCSVHIRTNLDSANYLDRVKDNLKEYNFPKFYSTSESHINDSLGGKAFPIVLVIRNGKDVIYRGSIEGIDPYLK